MDRTQLLTAMSASLLALWVPSACLKADPPTAPIHGTATARGTPRPPIRAANVDIRDRISARIDAIVARLNKESARSTLVVNRARSADRTQLASVVKDYFKTDARYSSLGPLIANAEAVPWSTGQADRARATIIDSVKTRSANISNYSAQLTALKKTIQEAPASQALALLEHVSIPNEMVVVIAGDDSSLNDPFTTPGTVGSVSLQEFITGRGAATVDYPATVAVLYNGPNGGRVVECSGSLIAVNVVVTAAHCLQDHPVAVYLQHGGIHEIDHAVPFPSFTQAPRYDIAALILKDAVAGVTPIPLNRTAVLPAGSAARIVGFGYHSGLDGSADQALSIVKAAGMKFYGNLTTGTCGNDYQNLSLICWTFAVQPLNALDATTCSGDSGGPLLIQHDGNWFLAGITSTGIICEPGDAAMDTEVYAYMPWLDEITVNAQKALPTTTVSSTALVPVIDNSPRFVMSVTGRTLSAASSTWTSNFTLAPNVKRLIVAMNTSRQGTTTGFSVGATGAQPACQLAIDDSVASCAVENPAAGPWQLTLSGVPNQEYQIVASMF